MIILLTLQLNILSQSFARDSTFLASSFLMPQRGAALLSRINYNNGDEGHKSFTTSKGSAVLVAGNQLCKMTAQWYLRVILL